MVTNTTVLVFIAFVIITIYIKVDGLPLHIEPNLGRCRSLGESTTKVFDNSHTPESFADLYPPQNRSCILNFIIVTKHCVLSDISRIAIDTNGSHRGCYSES